MTFTRKVDDPSRWIARELTFSGHPRSWHQRSVWRPRPCAWENGARRRKSDATKHHLWLKLNKYKILPSISEGYHCINRKGLFSGKLELYTVQQAKQTQLSRVLIRGTWPILQRIQHHGRVRNEVEYHRKVYWYSPALAASSLACDGAWTQSRATFGNKQYLKDYFATPQYLELGSMPCTKDEAQCCLFFSIFCIAFLVRIQITTPAKDNCDVIYIFTIWMIIKLGR